MGYKEIDPAGILGKLKANIQSYLKNEEEFNSIKIQAAVERVKKTIKEDLQILKEYEKVYLAILSNSQEQEVKRSMKVINNYFFTNKSKETLHGLSKAFDVLGVYFIKMETSILVSTSL
jgi:hypothetical protein